MKVTIEKRLETLEDLRLAKAGLRKKAKQHEAALKSRTEALYFGLSAERIYTETLDGFDANNLLAQLLPYLLKYKDQLVDNPVMKQLRKIKKKHLPYVTGAVAVLGAVAYSYFDRNDKEPQP